MNKNNKINEEKTPNGLKVTDASNKGNKQGSVKNAKDTQKKIDDVYKNDLEETKPNKFEYDDFEKTYHDEMEILNGQEMIEYGNEPDEKFKERAKKDLDTSDPAKAKERLKTIEKSKKKRKDASLSYVTLGTHLQLDKGRQPNKPLAFESKDNKTQIKNMKKVNENKKHEEIYAFDKKTKTWVEKTADYGDFDKAKYFLEELVSDAGLDPKKDIEYLTKSKAEEKGYDIGHDNSYHTKTVDGNKKDINEVKGGYKEIYAYDKKTKTWVGKTADYEDKDKAKYFLKELVYDTGLDPDKDIEYLTKEEAEKKGYDVGEANSYHKKSVDGDKKDIHESFTHFAVVNNEIVKGFNFKGNTKSQIKESLNESVIKPLKELIGESVKNVKLYTKLSLNKAGINESDDKAWKDLKAVKEGDNTHIAIHKPTKTIICAWSEKEFEDEFDGGNSNQLAKKKVESKLAKEYSEENIKLSDIWVGTIKQAISKGYDVSQKNTYHKSKTEDKKEDKKEDKMVKENHTHVLIHKPTNSVISLQDYSNLETINEGVFDKEAIKELVKESVNSIPSKYELKLKDVSVLRTQNAINKGIELTKENTFIRLQESKSGVVDGKIKSLKYKKEFNGFNKAVSLIPESYKRDGNKFEMTDGKETFLVKWEGSINEGTAHLIQSTNKETVNESFNKIKHLMAYSVGSKDKIDNITESTLFKFNMQKAQEQIKESITSKGEILLESVTTRDSEDFSKFKVTNLELTESEKKVASIIKAKYICEGKNYTGVEYHIRLNENSVVPKNILAETIAVSNKNNKPENRNITFKYFNENGIEFEMLRKNYK